MEDSFKFTPSSEKEVFEYCSKYLSELPDEFKKWKDVSLYQKDWAFILDSDIRYRICSGMIHFDYMVSLYSWLKPVMILKDTHKLACVQAMSSVIEAVLLDVLFSFVEGKEGIESDVLKKELSMWTIGKLQKILTKKEVLDSHWTARIKKFSTLRNYIHLCKGGVMFEEIYKEDPLLLHGELDEFRKYIKEKYENL